MVKFSSQGWHNQSVRHSNAKKYGKAGGIYSEASSKKSTASSKKPITESQENRLRVMKKNISLANETDARELYLYTYNNAEIYRQQLSPAEQNLIKKVKKGDYNSDLALLMFKNTAELGNKAYQKEFGHSFSVKERDAVAKELKDNFESEFL